MEPTPATTPRGRHRRELILAATAELVADRGFHAVGISDIGAAAGVSGAALYRHFDNKTALLVAVFERAIDGLLDGTRQVISDRLTDDATLAGLVAAHVEFAMRDRSVLAVYAQESPNLPDEDRRRLRRKQRQYVEIWKHVLRTIEPRLDDEVALTRVEAVFGLLNSAPYLSSKLRDTAVRAELERMARVALRSTAP
jgi:AcrR family transcriptional regulator